jgi:D-alanyl-D-alanine carboxypeptidase
MMNRPSRSFKSALLIIATLIVLLSGQRAEARYAAIVIEVESGDVLVETNADTRNYPASLTKMMTLYLLFEALQEGRVKPDQELKVSRRAQGMPNSKLGLKRGETITVDDAILALITKSANDVAVVVAESLAKSEIEFSQLMTAKAKQLGMTRTSFRNASGLYNRGHLSTARDMATLARALIRDFPERYQAFATPTFSRNGRIYRNHNTLLRSYQGADGLKTGYIRASGYNLAASARRDGVRLVAVLFGGKSAKRRDRQVAGLLDRGFSKLSDPIYLPTGGMVQEDIVPPIAKPQVLAAAAVSKRDEIAEATRQLDADRIWGVQVGAFYSYKPAKKAAEAAAGRLPTMLSNASVAITNVRGQNGKIYRARLLGMSESHARSTCKKLKALQTDCLVVQDRTGLELAQNIGS